MAQKKIDVIMNNDNKPPSLTKFLKSSDRKLYILIWTGLSNLHDWTGTTDPVVEEVVDGGLTRIYNLWRQGYIICGGRNI